MHVCIVDPSTVSHPGLYLIFWEIFSFLGFSFKDLIALLQGKKVKVPTFLVPATQKVCHATELSA